MPMVPSVARRLVAGAAVCGALAPAHAQDGADAAAAHLGALQRQIAEQTERLERLKQAVNEQQQRIDDIRRALGLTELEAQRGRAAPPRVPGAAEDPSARVAQAGAGGAPAPAPTPVGQAPQRERTVEVAPIFEQPGVLTPRGKAVLEPSLQYSYSSSNRVALVGYTVIPAILIGVVDVREVKRSTWTATLTGRYGLTNRFEVEARVPYVYRSDSTVGRAFFEGVANDTVFNASGKGLGDIEFTARYQLNDGGADRPYYVGSLRVKTRTGKDPFEVLTATTIAGLRGPAQSELPTGSGFWGIQPALTVLYPSDPAVLFGTVSYLHSVRRSHVTRNTEQGPESLGSVRPGGVFGFNFGMGLGLNDKSSFSIGYDHAVIGKIRQDGRTPTDAVTVQLGTLLLGYSYRMDPQRSLAVSLGAGLTRDTPDVTLTVRLPTTF